MAAHKGGQKRAHKAKGNQPVKKTYKAYLKSMVKANKWNLGHGNWDDAAKHNLQVRGLMHY